MKKLILVFAILIATTLPVHAETARTCSQYTNTYGGGEVCGETTAYQTVERYAETGDGENQAIFILGSIAIAAAFTTALYKLTYKSYIFG